MTYFLHQDHWNDLERKSGTISKMDSSFEEHITNTLEYEIKRSYVSKNKPAIIVKGPDGVTQYCCVECPVRCHDKGKLERHLLVHYDEYRFLCGICGTGLKRKEHLDRHTLEHQEHRPHVCEDCGKGFKRREHLNIHRSIHSGDKSQTCPLCGKAFYRKDHLQKHQQTHNKAFIENNIYPVSDQELMGIKEEVMDDSGRDELLMELQDSNDSTMNKITNSSHMVSNDADRPFACCVCNKTYKRKDHLKMHSLVHLKKSKVCSECGKGFENDDQLLKHMNIHLNSYIINSDEDDITQIHSLSGEQMDVDMFSSDNSLLIPKPQKTKTDRPHECTICHRKFKRKQHLKAHGNVHIKMTQPSVWCSLCNEGFFANQDFERHRCLPEQQPDDISEFCDEEQANNTPQEAKKENKYPSDCVKVNTEDKTKPDDKVQYVSIEEHEIPIPRRVYVCKYCSKPFKRKDHYKIHLHVHTGVKSLFCTDCGKGFYRKDHLQKHAQVHYKPRTVNTPKPIIKQKPIKVLPDLYPIKIMSSMPKREIKPEITIHAPLNTRLRVPLQIKVPYQMVMSMGNGEQQAVTVDPTCTNGHDIIS